PWRIDMFTDPPGDRAAQVRRVTLAKQQQLVAVKGSDQPTAPVYKLKQRLVSLRVRLADVRRIRLGARVFGESGSPWCVIEASTVALPSIGLEIGDWSRPRRVLIRCSPFRGSMRAMTVEVCPEIEQLVFEIRSGPEQSAI